MWPNPMSLDPHLMFVQERFNNQPERQIDEEKIKLSIQRKTNDRTMSNEIS